METASFPSCLTEGVHPSYLCLSVFICGSAGSGFLESACVANPFALDALIGAPGAKVFELLDRAAGPMQHSAFDAIPLAQSESHRHFRLRQIAGAALHHARSSLAAAGHAHGCADAVAVRLGSHQDRKS